MKKKIVYLFGSGASHAVINSIDSNKQLLTSDIRQKIAEKGKDIKLTGMPANIWNELMDPSVDIEHLISILDTNYHYKSTQKIREYYHDAIISLSRDVLENIEKPISNRNEKPVFDPNLYSILIDSHSIKDIREKVICLLTLNYEDILEKALKAHLNIDADYLIEKSTKNSKKRIPVLKLHGSFNWKNTRPIKVKKAHEMTSGEALWIPPGIDKKKETYPFNVLWGKAFEYLMECNTLRVVGCSLSRNDWGLIPMIYTAMRLSEKINFFEIEIIDFIDVGEKVKKDYPYLRIKSIAEIEEFKKYLVELFSFDYKNPIPNYVKEYISSNASKKINIFEWWLKAKRLELLDADINIATRKNYFNNFI
ncbi:MAG: SIR2 family protein [Ignavibacteriaceae bacterium]|jgi:hypothetical protein